MKHIFFILSFLTLCSCSHQSKQHDFDKAKQDSIQHAEKIKKELAEQEASERAERERAEQESAERAERERAEQEAEREACLSWIYGTWEYSSSYGNTIIVISKNNVKQYDNGELSYNGTYTIAFADIDNEMPCEIRYGYTSIPVDYSNNRLMADRNAAFRKVTSSTDVTITKNENSSSQIPKIYSADSFMNAVSSAQIYNSEGGKLSMKHNGLSIGGNTVSGFAPKVISYNSVGGVLQYETLDSHTITFMVDFSEKTVIGKVSGGSRNMYFTIR